MPQGNPNRFSGVERLSQHVTSLMRTINEIEDVVAATTFAYLSQFGSLGAGDGEFNNPLDITIDSSGNIYVVDFANNRVQKFNSSGVYQSQFGSAGSGDGEFDNPRDMAIDSSGNLYVSDWDNERIQKFNSSGVYQSQFGSRGSGDGKFDDPRGLAVDTDDNIYVADTRNSRVQKFNSSGVYQSQFGSNGSGDGQFSLPTEIVFDSDGNLYIADEGNHRVQKFSSFGVYQSQFGSIGAGNGEFTFPNGIVVDASGDVYVVDTSNDRVQKFSVTSGVGAQTTWTWKLTGGTTKSMGVVDGGVHIPATDAIYTGPPDSELGAGVHYDPTAHWKYIVDVRNAIQGIVGSGLINNPATGNAFDWDENSADNLYYVAMNDKRTMFGATGSKYTWERTLYKRSHTDIDIGEIDACVSTLRAAAVTQGLLT